MNFRKKSIFGFLEKYTLQCTAFFGAEHAFRFFVNLTNSTKFTKWLRAFIAYLRQRLPLQQFNSTFGVAARLRESPSAVAHSLLQLLITLLWKFPSRPRRKTRPQSTTASGQSPCSASEPRSQTATGFSIRTSGHSTFPWKSARGFMDTFTARPRWALLTSTFFFMWTNSGCIQLGAGDVQSPVGHSLQLNIHIPNLLPYAKSSQTNSQPSGIATAEGTSPEIRPRRIQIQPSTPPSESGKAQSQKGLQSAARSVQP